MLARLWLVWLSAAPRSWGVLFCGLAVTSRGVRVIEFNARFGDPETQAVLARLRTPLGQLLRAAARGEISEGTELDWDPRTAVDVVMAAENYPDTPRKGDVISGLDEANALEGVHVIHAGTAASEEGVLTAGGRVLAVLLSAMIWLLPVTPPTRVFALSPGLARSTAPISR